MSILEPFRRDPSEPYSSQAEIEAFFLDALEYQIHLRDMQRSESIPLWHPVCVSGVSK